MLYHLLSTKEEVDIMTDSLEKEFQYYIDSQDDLVKKYHGRYIVIKDQAVIGDYGSEIEAIEETLKKYKPGTFIVQKCEPGSDGYTQTYHSRTAFA
jgi:hypothetical protein